MKLDLKTIIIMQDENSMSAQVFDHMGHTWTERSLRSALALISVSARFLETLSASAT
jgi:hypothetical protein